MDRSEADEEWLARCADCGSELMPESVETYHFGVSGELCSACAERRGGTFDADRDEWTSPPDLSDLGERCASED
jgi:hypothetical protein